MSAISDVRSTAPALSVEQEYRLLFAATFGVFLVAALVLRIVRVVGGTAPTGTSLFAEAKATGYSALAFAFMG